MTRNAKNAKFVALCSAAVVCAASFAVVHSVVDAHHTALSTQTTGAARVTTTSHKAATKKRTVKPVKSTKTSRSTKKTVVSQKYKDGTYTGVGSTQIGAVQVAVTLKKDKITRVQITGSSTHYPIQYIDPILPTELMQRQDINKIDIVSGATLSTEDFYYAVVSCLRQAQQAEKSGNTSNA